MAPLTITSEGESLAVAAAEQITQRIERAAASHEIVFVTLTGGRTPARLYDLLADRSRAWHGRIPWSRLQFLWSDERMVPPDHPDSNFGMAQRTLLRHLELSPTQVHRIKGELPEPSAAAEAYDAELRAAFAGARRDEQPDVTLLGIGEDAHIASIFPDSALFQTAAPARLAQAVWASWLNAWRITLTPAFILTSGTILVMTSGEEKAGAVRAAIEDPADVPRYPAQLLRSAGDRVSWLMDAAAAARLSPAARRA